MRGFRGERWWVWVAMAVLASGIVILNILTAVLNHIMPSERPQPLPAFFWEAQEAASTKFALLPCLRPSECSKHVSSLTLDDDLEILSQQRDRVVMRLGFCMHYPFLHRTMMTMPSVSLLPVLCSHTETGGSAVRGDAN